MNRSDVQIIMVDPGSINKFASGIDYANNLMVSEAVRQMAGSEFWNPQFGWLRPYNVSGGVLTVPIKGSLLHDFPYQLGGYATGYEYIGEALKRGLADDEVETIAFEINSPGGYVSGVHSLADRIFASRSIKPSVALVNELACSAAYYLASAATKISAPKSGYAGSIGVVATHMDYSEVMSSAGIKVTYIYAGKHKVDGNPLEPLSDSVKERWQAEVESIYSDFVATVARNRSLEEEVVRNTEAQTFMATEALEIGLIDNIAPHPDSTVAIATLFNSEVKDQMATDKPQITTEGHEQAVNAARGEGMKEGAAAERVRITTILNSEAAKDRPKAALAAALKTDMDAEAAQSFLADLPKEKIEEEKPGQAGVGAEAFRQAMAGTVNPELGAGEENNDAQMSDDQKVARRIKGTLELIGIKKEPK